MFNFIPNELVMKVRESQFCIELRDDLKIGALLYADDIVFTAPNWRAARVLAKITEGWLKEY